MGGKIQFYRNESREFREYGRPCMYYAVGLNFGSDPRTFSTENKTKVTKGDLDSSDSLARKALP